MMISFAVGRNESFPTRSWEMLNGHIKFLVTDPPVAIGETSLRPMPTSNTYFTEVLQSFSLLDFLHRV